MEESESEEDDIHIINDEIDEYLEDMSNKKEKKNLGRKEICQKNFKNR